MPTTLLWWLLAAIISCIFLGLFAHWALSEIDRLNTIESEHIPLDDDWDSMTQKDIDDGL